MRRADEAGNHGYGVLPKQHGKNFFGASRGCSEQRTRILKFGRGHYEFPGIHGHGGHTELSERGGKETATQALAKRNNAVVRLAEGSSVQVDSKRVEQFTGESLYFGVQPNGVAGF